MRLFKALLIASALTLAPMAPIAAQTVPLAAPALISVTGEGMVQGAPDMAILSIGVTTEAKSATEAMAANSKALTTVLEQLKAAGIEPRDLQTSNLSLNPNWTGYDAASGGRPTIAGYTATNQLTVRIRAIVTLGGVLDAAIADGANSLNGLSFSMSDPRPATDAARVMAVKDARDKATLLVQAAGATLGRIVSINEGGSYSPQPAPMFRAASEAMAVPVESGEVSVNAAVTVVFEIIQ